MTARSYVRNLAITMVVYAIILVGSIMFLKAYPESGFRIPIALAPMIPALFVPFLVVRQLQQIDELQRMIQLEALGFAFAGTAILTFGYGFLENVDFPHMGGFVVWPIMAALWVVGLLIAQRRYR